LAATIIENAFVINVSVDPPRFRFQNIVVVLSEAYGVTLKGILEIQ